MSFSFVSILVINYYNQYFQLIIWDANVFVPMWDSFGWIWMRMSVVTWWAGMRMVTNPCLEDNNLILIETRQMDSRVWKLRLIDSEVISIKIYSSPRVGVKDNYVSPSNITLLRVKCPETNFIQNQLCTRPTGLPSPAGRTWRNYITQIVVLQLIKWTSIKSSKSFWLYKICPHWF